MHAEAAKKHLAEGHEWVVDLDLEKFFDRVHHERLVARLQLRIKDPRLIQLIRRMLKAKVVMPDGVVVASEEGTPQGGPLSPLLSNIVLDELDRELEQRGHRFVRYADDANIYVRSERAGQRVMASIVGFIERRLRLKVNAAKSVVAKAGRRHFVGFTVRRLSNGRQIKVGLSERSRDRIFAPLPGPLMTEGACGPRGGRATSRPGCAQGWQGRKADLPAGLRHSLE